MKSTLILLLLFLFQSQISFGAYGEFQDDSLIPSPDKIWKVETFLYDLVKEEPHRVVNGRHQGCNDTVCFRLAVKINDNLVANWIASPGKPHDDPAFPGNYTPRYLNGVPYSKKKRRGYNYISSRGDHMPWAAFWERNDRGNPVIATHCGVVDGHRRSHGCVRLRCHNGYLGGLNNARDLYRWVGAAQRNGGTATAFTNHTRPWHK